ncbi:hypothetical protein D3C71_1740040 [compost metagenome]
MRNVNHEYRRGEGFIVLFFYFQIPFRKCEISYAMVDLGIMNGGRHINLIEAVSKSIFPSVGILFFSDAGDLTVMVSFSCFFEFSENFLQG